MELLNCNKSLNFLQKKRGITKDTVDSLYIGIDKENLIVNFEEKPNNPKSTLLAPCIYIIKKDEIGLIDKYLESSPKNDAPGYFLEYFIKKTDFYALLTDAENYHDIGNWKSYLNASKKYQ